jgi:hypothetical protein
LVTVSKADIMPLIVGGPDMILGDIFLSRWSVFTFHVFVTKYAPLADASRGE